MGSWVQLGPSFVTMFTSQNVMFWYSVGKIDGCPLLGFITTPHRYKDTVTASNKHRPCSKALMELSWLQLRCGDRARLSPGTQIMFLDLTVYINPDLWHEHTQSSVSSLPEPLMFESDDWDKKCANDKLKMMPTKSAWQGLACGSIPDNHNRLDSWLQNSGKNVAEIILPRQFIQDGSENVTKPIWEPLLDYCLMCHQQ